MYVSILQGLWIGLGTLLATVKTYGSPQAKLSPDNFDMLLKKHIEIHVTLKSIIYFNMLFGVKDDFVVNLMREQDVR
jgi:hypothetical protein